MYQVLFTLDYEIHGNGDGSPYELMVEPTYRLMNFLEKYGAKLTIFADVAEIIKFKEFYEKTGEDKFYAQDIEEQLKYAIKNGHDVQMHIHSSYFKAQYKGGKWNQHWEEYNLAELPFERIDEIVVQCKDYLENLLRPVKSDYRCDCFRAANWSMMPGKNILSVLEKNGFIIDSSVFKYGKRSGRVTFDYSEAEDKLIPWYADTNNINKENTAGKILEIPIYSENRYFPAFVSPLRVFRMVRAQFHKHKKVQSAPSSGNQKSGIISKLFRNFTTRHAWKLDFNQASGRMLINACKRILKEYGNPSQPLPIVLIGHSKTFIKLNETLISSFMKYLSKNDKTYEFVIFNEIQREQFRRGNNDN